MSHARFASLLPLTMLLALAAATGAVRGSEVGFHEYLKHQHSQTIILPKLYEPVPKHVPVVADRQVLRLWLGPGSPILRDPNIEKQLYEAVVAWRNQNPRRFDQEHPTLGHLIQDREFFNYAMHLYNTHQARFVHYHHQLIPFLRGMAMELMQTPTAPETGGGTSPGVSPAPEGETNTPTPSPPQALEVPEPSSIVLMTLGIGFLGTGVWARRRIGRRARNPVQSAIPLPDHL